MSILRTALCLSLATFATMMSLGCGNSSSSGPLTSVTSTGNPLVAQYTIKHFQAGQTAWVEFGPDTNYGRQTSVMSPDANAPNGDALKILVAGMKPETLYHMRAHIDGPAGSWIDDDQTFTTASIPSGTTTPQITAGPMTAGATPAPGIELLSMTSLTNVKVLSTTAADLDGNIIWFCPGLSFPVKPLANGHFIINHNLDLQEVDLACDGYRDYTVADLTAALQGKGYTFTVDSFSHDVVVLPNGHWIALVQVTQDYTDLPGYPGTTAVLGDVIVDIDTNGNVVWSWSAFDHMDINRHLQGLPDWTHGNALNYTADGNLLLSMRHQSWIIKVDYANGTGGGDILWRLGQDGDFSIAGGDPSQWFYGQHDPYIVSSNGSLSTLNVFDDGNLRIGLDGLPCGSGGTTPACYSRATTFQIDESTHLATLVWQELPGYYSFWGGSIGTLANGNIEFAMSEPFADNPSASQIMEVTNSATPEVVWQMTINGENAYRGIRVPSLYPGVTWKQ